MNLTKSAGMIAAAVAALVAGAGAASAQPNPILFMTGNEVFTTGGQTFMRYRYDVLNKSAYPAAMFAAAPRLPPCGGNANSARTWVDVFENRTNRRLQGFCALGSPNDLGLVWFALPIDQIPPSYIYIELNDRQTNTKYRSNLADTVM